jgi:hypothetical protein
MRRLDTVPQILNYGYGSLLFIKDLKKFKKKCNSLSFLMIYILPTYLTT